MREIKREQDKKEQMTVVRECKQNINKVAGQGRTVNHVAE